MAREKKYYRSEATHVFGCMEGHLEVGATLIDIWYNKSHTWRVSSGNVGEVTGSYSGKFIGRVTEPDVLTQLEARS